MTRLVLSLSLLLCSGVLHCAPITYNYSGDIIWARAFSQSSSTFESLIGREFSGSVTFDTEDMDWYVPDFSNYYPATSANFFINTSNKIEFSHFDASPLIVNDTSLSVVAGSSATQGHEYTWALDGIDIDSASFTFVLHFGGTPTNQSIRDGLTSGTLNNDDFSREDVIVYVDEVPYPLATYLQLQVVEVTGPGLLDLKYHYIYGDITEFSAASIPEPSTILLFLLAVPLLVRRRVWE